MATKRAAARGGVLSAASDTPGEAANAERGELAITLEGVRYRLRPSFDALARIEGELGRGLLELLSLAQDARLTGAEIATVVCLCLRAEGAATGDGAMERFSVKRIAELIHGEEGGFFTVHLKVVLPLLAGAATGRYTALGEAKGAAGLTTPAPGFAA